MRSPARHLKKDSVTDLKTILSHKTNTRNRALKVLSIFSGVQVFSMACSVVKAKFIAILLGADGLGLIALYTEAIETIGQLFQLNLRTSGVRQLSAVTVSRYNIVVKTLCRLGSILGIIGALVMLLLSPLLSQWTFGDVEHQWQFAVLSVVIFLNSIVQPRQAILQAGSMFKRLAYATMWGSAGGTAMAIICYRLWHLDGIVPSLIIIATATFIAFAIATPPTKRIQVSKSDFKQEGTAILKLGTYLTAATFTTTLSSYIFISWLNRNSCEQEVGLYKAGFTIISQYVGVIFTAMSVEYFPRLSKVAHSTRRIGIYIRQETKLLLSIMTPCIIVFLPLVPFVIKILYSSSFDGIAPYIIIAATGTIMKATSFAMAYAIPARGDGAIYLVTESISSAFFLVLSIVGYSMMGLAGVGFGYVIWYLLYTLSVFIVCRFRYRLKGLTRLLIISLCITGIVAIESYFIIQLMAT